jgi:hypothetical protein
MNDHRVVIATELHSAQWPSVSVRVTSSESEHKEDATPAECRPMKSKDVNYIEIYKSIGSVLTYNKISTWFVTTKKKA